MKTLVSVANVLESLGRGAAPVLLDCSFDLSDPDAGERAWRAGHLPRAVYVHLDRDLAGAKLDAQGRMRGRHPLPERADFARRLGELGIGPGTAVVCYDAQGGPYAARAWWLLRWMGHADVAVLDGGIAAWRAAGAPMTNDAAAPPPAPPYPMREPALPTIEATALLAQLGRVPLIDARAGERYRGEVEPLDPAAGHIPGARNRFFKDNLAPDGRFKSADLLCAEWTPLLGGKPAAELVQQCGSGVTACHNLLALAHAGLGDSVLYPGSWSEWSADPSRPQAKS
jgi:thiosulfate/3-mercaptopyruvate sulfurtransferase